MSSEERKYSPSGHIRVPGHSHSHSHSQPHGDGALLTELISQPQGGYLTLTAATLSSGSPSGQYSPFNLQEANILDLPPGVGGMSLTAATPASPSSVTSSTSCSPVILTIGTQGRLQQHLRSALPPPPPSQPQPRSHLPATAAVGHNGFSTDTQSLPVQSEISSTGPFLSITEQPTNRIRYRYKSEKGSHGGLTGENSTQTKKTYPTVKLDNYNSTRQVLVKASLVTNEEHPKAHVHKLMGRHCTEDGVCMIPLAENHTAIFQNLGILFVGKKEVPEILFQRKLEEQRMMRAIHNAGQLSGLEVDKQRLREEAEREAKDMNLNCVKICFEALDYNHDMNFPVCEPVFSRPVANQKSPDSGELKIVRMDKYSGVCSGDEEVYLLCEKVNKKEIKVRFFESDNEGNQLWEAFGSFTEADVHHQVAIVFRTPPYKDQNIDRSVQVYLQLYRPKDGEYSEPRPFTYKPKEHDREGVERKRRKVSHYNPQLEGQYPTFAQRFEPQDGGSTSGPSGNADVSSGYYGTLHGYYRSDAFQSNQKLPQFRRQVHKIGAHLNQMPANVRANGSTTATSLEGFDHKLTTCVAKRRL